jgi:hypothetical protein
MTDFPGPSFCADRVGSLLRSPAPLGGPAVGTPPGRSTLPRLVAHELHLRHRRHQQGDRRGHRRPTSASPTARSTSRPTGLHVNGPLWLRTRRSAQTSRTCSRCWERQTVNLTLPSPSMVHYRGAVASTATDLAGIHLSRCCQARRPLHLEQAQPHHAPSRVDDRPGTRPAQRRPQVRGPDVAGRYPRRPASPAHQAAEVSTGGRRAVDTITGPACPGSGRRATSRCAARR